MLPYHFASRWFIINITFIFADSDSYDGGDQTEVSYIHHWSYFKIDIQDRQVYLHHLNKLINLDKDQLQDLKVCNLKAPKSYSLH